MPSKSTRQQNPDPQPLATVVSKDGDVKLVNPGISCSDSALHRGPEFRPLSHVHFRQDTPVHRSYSPKSVELRRKSETNLISGQHCSPRYRCKSDLELANKGSINAAEIHRRKAQTVPRDSLTRQRRSLAHVTKGIAACDKVVTKQPRNVPGPECNPDWPALCESDYENCDSTVVLDDDTVTNSNSNYGMYMVTEGIKGLLQFMHHPFQCCQKKVCELISFYI